MKIIAIEDPEMGGYTVYHTAFPSVVIETESIDDAKEKLLNTFHNIIVNTDVDVKVFDTNCYDKFDNVLKAGDWVDVQSAGEHQIYEKNGKLYFTPYGEEELVITYFKNDIIKIEK